MKPERVEEYSAEHWQDSEAVNQIARLLSFKVEQLIDKSVGSAIKNFLEDSEQGVAVILDAWSLKVTAHDLDMMASSPGEDLIKLIDEAIETELAYPERQHGPLSAMKKVYLDWIAANPGWEPRTSTGAANEKA